MIQKKTEIEEKIDRHEQYPFRERIVSFLYLSNKRRPDVTYAVVEQKKNGKPQARRYTSHKTNIKISKTNYR